MFDRPACLQPERLAGLGFVVLAHAALLYGLWQARVLPMPEHLAPVFVDFITPAAPPPAPEPPKPVRLEPVRPPLPQAPRPPAPQQLVAEDTVPAPAATLAPRPEPQPAAVVAPPPAPPAAAVAPPSGPVRLSDELSLACPERTPPVYPAHLRRRGVEGSVTVRAEIDEQGAVAQARIERSSGNEALDAAALNAVRQWRCQPPQRAGRPVRALALQPFNFTMQGQ